jgi:hypothetical protein
MLGKGMTVTLVNHQSKLVENLVVGDHVKTLDGVNRSVLQVTAQNNVALYELDYRNTRLVCDGTQRITNKSGRTFTVSNLALMVKKGGGRKIGLHARTQRMSNRKSNLRRFLPVPSATAYSVSLNPAGAYVCQDVSLHSDNG